MEFSTDCNEAVAGDVADALVDAGWYAGASVFSDAFTMALADRAQSLAQRDELSDARVGRLDGAQRVERLRGDETRWLSDQPDDATESRAVATVRLLRERLNELLFLNTNAAELHFARYAPGAFYRTHRDRFRDDDARVVSMIFYLNADWPGDAGGELVLYGDDDGNEISRIPPAAGTMVCFLSERFPHEVLPATRERFSLTGWLRRESAVTGR